MRLSRPVGPDLDGNPHPLRSASPGADPGGGLGGLDPPRIMADETPTGTDAGTTEAQISATIGVDSVVFALKMNATDGADTRVIAVPRSGGEASLRRAFRGSERYANPSQAPVHIRPEQLVEEEWARPPERHEVDTLHMDIPDEVDERTQADEARYEEAFDELVSFWETDVRGMIRDTHHIEIEDLQLALEGVTEEEDR